MKRHNDNTSPERRGKVGSNLKSGIHLDLGMDTNYNDTAAGPYMYVRHSRKSNYNLVTFIGNQRLAKSNVAYDVIIAVAHDVINYVTKYFLIDAIFTSELKRCFVCF